MGSQPAVPKFVDVWDTFYEYVSSNIATLLPQAVTSVALSLQGIANAQDWPQDEIVDGGLYLLYLTSVPIEEDGTRAQTCFEHYFQWTWILMGSDLAANQVGANRGDRYRNNAAVVEMLRQAHFPGYCAKRFSSLNPVTGAVTFTNYNPEETIRWSMPRFGSKLATGQSGLIYGTAPLEVYAWSAVNPLVNP